MVERKSTNRTFNQTTIGRETSTSIISIGDADVFLRQN